MTLRIEQYQKLPENVQDFLFDTVKEEEAKKVLVADGVTEGQAFDLILLAEDVVFGAITITALPAKVVELTGLSEEKGRSVVRDLITYRLLPLEAFVVGVPDFLKALGGDAASAPVEPVAKEKITPEQFVKESLKESNLSLADAALESRLEFILASYVRGVRPLTQTIAALGRPLKVGGLALAEAQAKQLVELIDERRGVFDIELAAEQRMEIKEKQPQPLSPLPPLSPLSKPTLLESPLPAAPASGPESAIDALLRLIEALPIPALSSSDLMKRLGNIALTRMKDLRTAVQTKALFQQDVLTGGLGLSAAEAEQVSMVLEKAFQEVRNISEKKVAEDREQYLAKKKMEAEEKTARQTREDEELVQRYVALTGKTPQPVKPALPRLSAASLRAPDKQQKPQMADVKFAPKLAGPLEEIGQMQLADWRRLASDPAEAMLKIRDKIDLLGTESYEKKVAGIRAWKASPVNQLYVAMSQEALKAGKTMVDIAEIWKGQGKEALTAPEVKAIVELNATLRF